MFGYSEESDIRGSTVAHPFSLHIVHWEGESNMATQWNRLFPVSVPSDAVDNQVFILLLYLSTKYILKTDVSNIGGHIFFSTKH